MVDLNTVIALVTKTFMIRSHLYGLHLMDEKVFRNFFKNLMKSFAYKYWRPSFRRFIDYAHSIICIFDFAWFIYIMLFISDASSYLNRNGYEGFTFQPLFHRVPLSGSYLVCLWSRTCYGYLLQRYVNSMNRSVWEGEGVLGILAMIGCSYHA